jgi:TetR/AcrR family transcriptional regulator, regulator of cefoperazone and chloramphenicol sensitivity
MSTDRTDGGETRERVLEAAGGVFADVGYHDATVAEICERAQANVAAISYHFGGKAELYALVWRRAFDEGLRAYPPDGGLPPGAPPEKRLRARLHALLARIFDDGRNGRFSRLLLAEMARPTEALDKVRREVIGVQVREMNALLREILGPDLPEDRLALCRMSLIHQCLGLGWRRGQRKAFLGRDSLTPDEVADLADHITTFSLAGMAAVRNEVRR